MGGFAALLIGASDYGSVGTPLPFVPRDLERLEGALRARRFRVERPVAHGRQVGKNFINGEVTGFLRNARRGETLLICLSGHGMHEGGTDYLIPEDLHRDLEPLWSGCVAIDWRREVETTPAARVLFLIDACREGVRQDTMSGTVGWASGEALAVANRQVAHLYACSAGGYAYFVGPGEAERGPEGGSFSLFSRAVLDVLRSSGAGLNLEQLRVGVQARIDELHRAYGKKGSPQRVRVLTDHPQADFLVADAPTGGPSAVVAALPTAAGRNVPAPEPRTLATDLAPDAPDLGQLLADAVHQLRTTGSTALLEAYAAVGPTAGLLDLGTALEAAPVAALWAAAGARRPFAPLMELVAAVCGVGRPEVAHRLLESAAAARPAAELLAALDAAPGPPDGTTEELRSTVLRALAALPADALAAAVLDLHRAGLVAEATQVAEEPRPPEDLPPLLAALTAEGLRPEVDRVVLSAVTRLDPRSVDRLLAVLSGTGQAGPRAAALRAVAAWSVDGIVGWLRFAGGREGLERDAAFVVQAVVAGHPDWPDLPERLRRAGLSRYLGLFHEECARRDSSALVLALQRLVGAGAHQDALAVVHCAAEALGPHPAAELTVLLSEHGPDELLHPVLAKLLEEPPDRVADYLARLWELPAGGRAGRDPVEAAVSVLGTRYPEERLWSLLGMLELGRLPALVARLRGVLARDRPAAELLTVLAWAPATAGPVLLRRIVVVREQPGRFAELLQLCDDARFVSLGEPLVQAFVTEHGTAALTGVLAELRARDWQYGERLVRDWLRLNSPAPADPAAEAPDGPPADPPDGPPAGPGAVRAAEPRTPGETAELILALDARGPDAGAAAGHLTDVLGAFLDAEPVERAAELIGALRTRQPGEEPGERLAEALRVRAVTLFGAARARGSEPDTRYLLSAFRGEPPLRVEEFRALHDALRRTGSAREAGLVLDRLGRRQPPQVVTALLQAFRDDDAFEVLCEAAAERPVRDVAAVLRHFPLVRRRGGLPVHRFVEYVTRTADPDRCRALLVELLTGRQDALAGAVLRAACWTGSAEELDQLFLALDEQGDEARRLAIDALAPELPASLALGVLDHLHRHGAEEVGLPVLRARARTVDDVPAFWSDLNERGWFRYAAVLIDDAAPDTPVEDWFRHLHGTALGPLDRAALLRATEADGPVAELAAGGGAARSALAAAAVHRRPQDVADLLAALAEQELPLPPPLLPRLPASSGRAAATRPWGSAPQVELWRILAAARPAPELDLILAALEDNGRQEDAERIVEHLLADEPVGRIADLLEAAPGDEASPAATLLARQVLASGAVAKLVGRLVRNDRPRGVERLAGALTALNCGGAAMAHAVASLTEAGVAPEAGHRLTVGHCAHRSPEDVADFLHHLGRAGQETVLRQALATVTARRQDDLAAIGRCLEQLGDRALAAGLAGPAAPGDDPAGPADRRRWPRWKDIRRP